jgi:hypothetical protein
MQESIGGLLWYVECKNLAIEAVMNFRPPADSHAMRMYHSMYLTSLMSLLELAVELFGPEVAEGWKRALDGQGGQSGENNAAYLTELRNAVVHRGENIVVLGTVVEDQTCAIAPPQAFHRLRKKGPHGAFALLLRNVFARCEDAIGSAILPAANDTLKAEEGRSAEDLRTQYRHAVDESPYMPDWVKQMALKHVDQVPFEDLRGFQAKKLRHLLSCGARPGLALAI